MAKEAYKERDFQRTVQKYDQRQKSREVTRKIKKEMRTMRKQEYCLNSPKMTLERRILGTQNFFTL